MLPYYLAQKLKNIDIYDLKQLHDCDPIKVFQWLKYIYRSIGYNVLFDLYSITTQDPFPTKEKQAELIKLYHGSLPSYPSPPLDTTNYFLNKAVAESTKAKNIGEIPIGAVIVREKEHWGKKVEDFEIIGQGHNLTISNNDICAHAEIQALQNAGQNINNHRLHNCDLYVTIEPCLMCMGAILHSRIRRVIYGAIEPKTGAIISQYQILNNKNVNHQTEAIGPINNNLYGEILTKFMQQKRKLASYKE